MRSLLPDHCAYARAVLWGMFKIRYMPCMPYQDACMPCGAGMPRIWPGTQEFTNDELERVGLFDIESLMNGDGT